MQSQSFNSFFVHLDRFQFWQIFERWLLLVFVIVVNLDWDVVIIGRLGTDIIVSMIKCRSWDGINILFDAFESRR
jgi:hypothetical protein